MKTTQGRLYTRQSKKHGKTYWLDYSINNKRYRHKLTDPDGQPVTNKRDAEKAAEKVLAPFRIRDEAERRKAVANQYRDAVETAREIEEQSKPKTLIAEMWERKPWDTNRRGNTERKLADFTVYDNSQQWRKFVEWAEANNIKFAEDVSAEDAAAFQKSLTNISNNRINKVVLCCKVMFELSGIEPNPFIKLRKKHHKPQSRRELTEAELRSVCGKAEGELRTLFAVGLYTGLRLGDACRLRWEYVTGELTAIKLDPSKTEYKRNNAVVLPIHPVLKAILEESPEASREGFIMPDLANSYIADTSQAAKKIQKHFKECGIKTQRDGTGKDKDGKHTGKRAVVDVGFHSLRHSFVSLCARQNVPLHVVRALTSHSSEQVQRLYLHANPIDAQNAISTLPDFNGTSNPDPRTELHNLIDKLPTEKIEDVLSYCKNLVRF